VVEPNSGPGKIDRKEMDRMEQESYKDGTLMSRRRF